MTGLVLVDGTGVPQMTEDLGHEERVAIGLTVDHVGEANTECVETVPRSCLHQRMHARLVQSAELQAGDTLLAPDRPQRLAEAGGLGKLAVAEGSEHQHPHGRLRRSHLAEQGQAPAVGPLEIVEDENDGLLPRELGQQPDGCGKQEVALRVGVGGLRRRQVGDPVAERRHQPRPFGPEGAHQCPEAVLIRMGDNGAERLREELVGSGEVLLAVPEQDTGPVAEGEAGRFSHEGALPLARLA